MSRQQRPITDREIKAWLAAGAVDRGVGEGLTFVASTMAARAGKASSGSVKSGSRSTSSRATNIQKSWLASCASTSIRCWGRSRHPTFSPSTPTAC
jgi:hypothetical protein